MVRCIGPDNRKPSVIIPLRERAECGPPEAPRLPEPRRSMSVVSLKLATSVLTVSLCMTALVVSAAAQKGSVRKHAKKQDKQVQSIQPLPPYTPAPLQPVPLDQVPAVAPKVQYEDGKLTIAAHNSTLSDVLKAVRQQTGAEMEIPANATERVVADLGPGPARSVLAELLNGTHFNYVMVGSTTDPTAVQSVMLTPRTAGPDGPMTAAANPPGVPRHAFAPPPMINSQPVEVSPASDETADEAETAEDETATEQADQTNQTNPAQQTPKTPEQLLQELQRQQLQMQQQQGQQNPQNPPGGQTPQGLIPNQPPTAAPPATKPE